MLLVERYVAAVRSYLPRKQRNDIAAELGDALRSHIESAEAERGRPLTEDDIVAILQRYGSPMVVAARYGGRDHLIGPAVYPYYKIIVKTLLWVVGVLLACALLLTALTADEPAPAMARAIGLGLLIGVGNLTIITLIFARLEGSHETVAWADRWDPRDLLRGNQPPAAISRREMIGALLMTLFWLLWWIDVLPLNQWLLWDHLPLTPAPIWHELTPWIVSLMVINMAISSVALLQPRWVRFYQAATLVLDAGIAVVLYRALRTPAYLLVTDDRAAGVALAGLLNALITAGLVALGVVVGISIVSTLRQWLVAKRFDRPRSSWSLS
jgi:hypothetical protein